MCVVCVCVSLSLSLCVCVCVYMHSNHVRRCEVHSWCKALTCEAPVFLRGGFRGPKRRKKNEASEQGLGFMV